MKAVSLDFWNTIATPNKTYAKLRTEYLADNYGLTKDDYTKAKNHLDKCAELYGTAVTPRMAVTQLFYPLSNWSDEIDVDKIVEDFEKLFLENPPTVKTDVEKALVYLLDNNCHWGIISNTNFVSGVILRIWLYNYLTSISTSYREQVKDVPMVFSDLVGVSKPNIRIFLEFFNQIHWKSGQKLKTLSDINHIGDHEICDVQGAKLSGYTPHLYKSGSTNMAGLVRQIFNK